MTGLEKIVEQINKDAAIASSQLLDEAKKQADAKYADAMSELDKRKAVWKEQNEAKEKLELSRGVSAANLKKRKMILEAKQEIIQEVLEDAKAELLAQTDSKYFENIMSMINKNARKSEAGVIIFNAKDLKRLPANFDQDVTKYQLTVSKETRKIDGGFVLQYGEIEENCSFEALFAQKKESLQDKVCELLFE